MVKKWTEEETKYLIDNYQKRDLSEISVVLNRTYEAVRNKCLRIGLMERKWHCEQPNLWAEKEIDYLKSALGYKSIAEIAGELGRSVAAVKQKKGELKLFPVKNDCIVIDVLFKTLGYSGSKHSHYRLLRKRNFPFSYIKGNSRMQKAVSLSDFWVWAEQNQTALNFSNFEDGALGKEPEWVAEKRKRDKFLLQNYNQSLPWTDEEEKLLVNLLKEKKYDCKQLSLMLQRSENAIFIKIHKLGIKERPVRQKKQGEWTEKEFSIFKELIKTAYCYEQIAEKIDKSALSISRKALKAYGTTDLSKIREILKNDNNANI